MIHAADIANSERLQRLMRVLSDGLPHTTAEISGRTGSVAVHTDAAEIRAGGVGVRCRFRETTPEGRRVYEYQLTDVWGRITTSSDPTEAEIFAANAAANAYARENGVRING